MNFLLRPTQSAAAAVVAEQTPPVARPYSKTTSTVGTKTTLEGLIAEDNKSDYSSEDSGDSFGGDSNGHSSNPQNFTPLVDKHVDVKEDEGWIAIPFKEIPDNWDSAPDMNWFHSLDRSFVFPGEQVHVLACLSASKQETEIITPFKVAAVMSKNGSKYQNGSIADQGTPSEAQQMEPDGHTDAKSESNQPVDISASEFFLKMEDHRRQTQTLLQKFKQSHFFVRIAESGDQLWSKRDPEELIESAGEVESVKPDKTADSGMSISAALDTGRFDARVSGGLARDSIKCCSLANGDIVVLLQVNVGVDSLKDPVLEILQFERHYDKSMTKRGDVSTNLGHSPYGELVKWLLPLDNSHQPVSRPSPSTLVNASHKSSFSATTGSQLFSFGHFRSYSMSSLPQNTPPTTASPPTPVSPSKPKFDLEDWDRFASHKFLKGTKTGSQDLMSFRGVPLEPERFSVCCGLEGIYIPGRRWRRKLEIIQPIDIHTFASDCNTDDLLCVQIKNVSPVHVPDIVVYIDAITIILEEATKVGPPLSVPIACVEAGNDHALPNLALRSGEEHSFILKPAISALKKSTTVYRDKTSHLALPKARSMPGSMQLPPKAIEPKKVISPLNKYAVLVSCHCNYSDSRLFFKKRTNWRPRISRDLMISVASEMSKKSLDLTGRISQLPVQVLTLQASNLTSEDLTLTILAPASYTPPPSVLSALSSPMSPFVGVPPTQRISSVSRLAEKHNAFHSLSPDDQAVPIADMIPATALTCTHLWLHSRVPLGCVASQSTATIKLGLLPLTDGIITLDTLQIYVKEKGANYVPEHVLKINATSSIAAGMIL